MAGGEGVLREKLQTWCAAAASPPKNPQEFWNGRPILWSKQVWTPCSKILEMWEFFGGEASAAAHQIYNLSYKPPPPSFVDYTFVDYTCTVISLFTSL